MRTISEQSVLWALESLEKEHYRFNVDDTYYEIKDVLEDLLDYVRGEDVEIEREGGETVPEIYKDAVVEDVILTLDVIFNERKYIPIRGWYYKYKDQRPARRDLLSRLGYKYGSCPHSGLSTLYEKDDRA
jgi:hypothetical protein